MLTYTLQGLRSEPMARYSGTVTGWNQIAYLHSQWPKIAMAGGAGYIIGYPGRGAAVSFSVNMPNTTSAALRSVIDPILAGLRGRSLDVTNSTETGEESELTRNRKPHIVGKYTDYDTFEAARKDLSNIEEEQSQKAASQTFAGIGGNKILTSWLWSAKDVASPLLQQALRGSIGDVDAQLYSDATMGIGTHNPPYIRGGGNAVNPALRTAIMRPATELQWDGTNLDTLARRQQDALRYGAALKALSPAGGTYANEADPNSPDWQHAFWGSNYERLLTIKNSVDPKGIFYVRPPIQTTHNVVFPSELMCKQCRSCVGSEQFIERGGVLCRR